MSPLQSFYNLKGNIEAEEGPAPSYTENSANFGFDVIFYFHNNKEEQKSSQKSRGVKYQYLPPSCPFLKTNSVLPGGSIRLGMFWH